MYSPSVGNLAQEVKATGVAKSLLHLHVQSSGVKQHLKNEKTRWHSFILQAEKEIMQNVARQNPSIENKYFLIESQVLKTVLWMFYGESCKC